MLGVVLLACGALRCVDAGTTEHVEFSGYSADIDEYGRITNVRIGDRYVFRWATLWAYPADGSTALIQGYPRSGRLDKGATRITREDGKTMVERKGILGNETHPQALEYTCNSVLTGQGEISVIYRVKNISGIGWKGGVRTKVSDFPHGLIAGRGWLAENDAGTMKTGTNPEIYRAEDQLKWVSCCRDCERVYMKTEQGLIKVEPVEEGKLGGYTGKDGVFFRDAKELKPEKDAQACAGIRITLPIRRSAPCN